MALRYVSASIELFQQLRRAREIEERQAKSNPFLAQALEREKREGHRLAVLARTIALVLVGLLLPFLNPNLNVLYYEVVIALFIALGWLQLRVSSVGYSRTELSLLLAELSLLTLLFITPNPFLGEEVPTALIYRFDNFIYFFIFLAVGTLAYSWRTVWSIGTWVAMLWLLGALGISIFGHEIPELSSAAVHAFDGYDLVQSELDPNGLQFGVRAQEMIVFFLVAGILAIKGWRTNQLLAQQADIAAERANLSRYFPSNLVDVLASTDHDIGAVRTQNVAVLFTDIVGFTQFAEQHSPQEVMALLRRYHEFVERSIFQNGGTLDKYIGDGVMATFGTPETSPDDAANALNAAQQLMNETQAFNDDRQSKGLKPIHISIGLHYGPVILGDIGPERRLEFAVVGDTVNVASRLEASTRELGCQCVVSEDLMRQARHKAPNAVSDRTEFTQRNSISLRGRKSKIGIWAV
ncbi:MAG: adenylate/guanylate cyclase domain-containing protein [Pseudomonadota bacterium]